MVFRLKRRAFLLSFLLFLAFSYVYVSRETVSVRVSFSHDGVREACVSNCGGADPSTFIWRAPDLGCGEFNVATLTTCYGSATRDGNVFDLMTLRGNGTFASVALSKSPVDLSVIGAKQFWSLFTTSMSVVPSVNGAYGVYLTRNGTLPSMNGYDPLHDKSVGLMLRGYLLNVGIGNYEWDLDFQRSVNSPMSADYGSCSVGATGSCFDDIVYIRDIHSHWIGPNFVLNFTGSTDSAGCNAGGVGSGCSFLSEVYSGGVQGQQAIPPFLFQGQSYYVGFWASAGLSSDDYWTLDVPFGAVTPGVCSPCNQMILYQPQPTAVIAPPNLDVGGFLSPVVNVFFAILNFIFGPLFNVVNGLLGGIPGLIWSTLSGAMAALIAGLVAILNSALSAAGLGSLPGTLFSFFASLVDTVISGVLGIGAIGFVANFVGTVTQYGNLIVNFVGHFAGGVVAWFYFVIALFNAGWSWVSLFFGQATTPSLWLLVMIADLVWGIAMAEGGQGAAWIDMNINVVKYPFALTWWAIWTVLELSRWVKMMVFQWL